MSALTTVWHGVLAFFVGVMAFFLGLFLPVWTLMSIGRDPGNIGGGLLTIWIGGPFGVVCGLAAGIFSFRKLRSKAVRNAASNSQP